MKPDDRIAGRPAARRHPAAAGRSPATRTTCPEDGSSEAMEVDISPATARPGPRIYNLFPLMIGPVPAWHAHLPRIAAMAFDWVYVNPFHEAGFSGSLYAIRDPGRLDPRLRGPAGSDDEQIAAFAEQAAQHGLSVMADLVINHTSRDAVLAAERPDLYRRGPDGALLSPVAVDPADPSVRTEWGDLAELDYERPESSGTLVDLFDRYIGRMQGLGVRGFRCDAAYKVPAAVWHELIGRARARHPDTAFAAETLGCTVEEASAVAAAGFDWLFNSFAWWDLAQPWALQQYDILRRLAPSISFPENHDMARLAADLDPADPEAIARHLKLRYALAAAFSSGVLMPIGYEWGWRKPLHVVETTPADAETTGIDISDFIGAVNRARAASPALNVEGAQSFLSRPGDPLVILARLSGDHALVSRDLAVTLANIGAAPSSVDPGRLMTATGGVFERFKAVAPLSHGEIVPGSCLVLGPGEVCFLRAEHDLAPRRPAVAGPPVEPDGAGRVVIEAVAPQIDGGRAAAKRVVGDVLEVSADIFCDGHDVIAADVLFRAEDEEAWRRTPMHFIDNDRWAGHVPLTRNTRYLFTIEAWRDPFASWTSEVGKKAAAGQPVMLETVEGLHFVRDAARAAVTSDDAEALARLVDALGDLAEGSHEQLALMLDGANVRLIARHSTRADLSRYPLTLEVVADRLAARYGAWYELFPRSQSGSADRHGTFGDVIARLPHVAAMGFDVLYFPPIHPIGTTNRKGRNNSLTAGPGDVGSVYAIGSEAGGHEAVHPGLGTLDDFRRLVRAAQAHGLEIALDFAVQCSPDHPWIREHPEWFAWRPDGTLKFAENPPKKYEDIVNVEFYGAGLPSLWYALRDTVLGWAEEGVRIFRVDNPHTKPLPFWAWLIREINACRPDVIFLAEAFTRPKMMRKLAKIGFQQSYTYFTWRNNKNELIKYIQELSHGEMADCYRPNFFVNTPDINPYYMQTSGRPGFIVRATLAATLSSLWGVYAPFELCEATPISGKEEYLDSEKYEIRVWDHDRPGHIRDHIGKLNLIRREHPVLQDFRDVLFLNAWNDSILAYARILRASDGAIEDAVLVIVNLDPHTRQECDYEVPLWEFGLPDHASIEAEDLLGGGRFTLHGKVHRIALDPGVQPVVIWRLVPPESARRPSVIAPATPLPVEG